MSIDSDLQSIQDVRDALQKVKQAQLEFHSYSQEQVDRIVQAMAEAGFPQRHGLEEWRAKRPATGNPRTNS